MNATRRFCFAIAMLGWSIPAVASNHQYRLVVKFASECCGIDKDAAKQLTNVIATFERQTSVKITSERTWWGKEGEYNQCFKLKEMNDKMKAAFIAKVKSSITSKLVKIEENAACKAGW